MKIQIFIVSLSFIFPYCVMPSWPVSEWPEVKFEEKITYDELCKYDELCGKLKNRKGKFKFPHSIILKIFWLQKEELASIAKKYGIHPIIPMAAIATEHSLNVGIEDKWQDNLKSLGLDKNGRLLGLKAVSYGYGQLYREAAMNAEKIVARTEKRSQEEYEYVQKRIKSIAGAYEYVSALMLYYTEAYAQEGIDISHRPDILSTLYNIGKVDERIRMTMSEGRRPQANYFGWFVVYNWKSFESIYANDGFNLEYIADLEQSLQESGNDGLVGKLIGSLQKNQVPSFTITDEIYLRDAPPWCDLENDIDYFVSESGMEKKEKKYLESIQNSQLHPYKGKGHFDIYAKSFDCLGRIWGLLNFTDSGTMGWVNLESAGEFIEIATKKRQCEQTKIEHQCIEEIKVLLDSPDDFLDYNEEQHIVYIRLGDNSLLEANEINWHPPKSRWEQHKCENSSIIEEMQEKYESYLKQLKTLDSEQDKDFDINDINTDDLTLEWILYFNREDQKYDSIPTSQEKLENYIKYIKQYHLANVNDPYIHVLTDADKEKLTPMIYQALSKIESEINIPHQKLDLKRNIVMALMKEDNIYNSNLFLATVDDIGRLFFPSFFEYFEDFKFLYKYLYWGYRYLYYCLDEERVCILTTPVEKIEQTVKDIIEYGFHADYYQEELWKKRRDRWFYSLDIKNERKIYKQITIQESIEILNPWLLQLSNISEGFYNEIMPLYELYSFIENTDFVKLNGFRLNTLDNWITKFHIIISFMKNEPMNYPIPKRCFISSYRELDSDSLERIRDIPCKYFHLFLWDHEKLVLTIRAMIKSLKLSPLNKIRLIQSKVANNMLPPDDDKSLDSNISKNMIIHYMKDARSKLAQCNYNFRKTFDIVKRLSQSSCVDKLLLPEEKLLNNKCREEGIHFNTIPFGEYTDRMAIKLKSICE